MLNMKMKKEMEMTKLDIAMGLNVVTLMIYFLGRVYSSAVKKEKKDKENK